MGFYSDLNLLEMGKERVSPIAINKPRVIPLMGPASKYSEVWDQATGPWITKESPGPFV